MWEGGAKWQRKRTKDLECGVTPKKTRHELGRERDWGVPKHKEKKSNVRGKKDWGGGEKCNDD